MDKKVKDNSRSHKSKKQMFTTILIAIIILVGGTTIKAFASFRTTATIGIFTKEIFTTMILNNPINLNLNEEIKRLKEEDIQAKVQAIRDIDKKKREEAREAQRLEEEIAEKNRKKVYLTFDDGPSQNITPRILDILSEHDIKATFFVFGRMASLNPEILKRTYEEGHAIGHHSYSHDYNYIYRNTKNFIGELDKTNELFKSILGEEFETKLLRFPGGSFEKRKQKFIVETEKLGYMNYDWNALNGDAEGHNMSREYLIKRLKSTVKNKEKEKEIIVLMHDTDAKSTTADVLPEIIDFFIKEGYVFRTLNEK